MKKFYVIMAAALLSLSAAAQELTEAQQASVEAAEEIVAAPEAEPAAPKFKDFWTNSLKTNLTFGQTALVNWAAGGDNTYSLAAYIDANANYKKDEMFWNNRLQLDYGFLYASSKPLLQKNMDRIYLESKWGYKLVQDKLYFSANYDFKTQFTKGFNYNTPSEALVTDLFGAGTELSSLKGKDLRKAWREARTPVSNFLSPAYTTLALGIDWTPAKWISVNFAPLTGGYVIVTDAQFRKAYGMGLQKKYYGFDPGVDPSTISDLTERKTYEDNLALYNSGNMFRSARFEFGAQLKIDAKVNINEVFAYSTQLVLFEDYLKDHKIHPCPRINWDNRIDWKIAKFFALTVTTNFIYDDFVMFSTEAYDKKCAKNEKYNAKWGAAGWANKGAGPLAQFKESLSFGFTYTIASKAK